MQKVLLTHNPYKVISTIEINGEKPKRDSTLIQYLDKRFQLWVDKLPELLEDVCNDDNFEITFHGTELDYQDLRIAIEAAESKGLSFKVNKIDAKEFGEKEADIRNLFSEIQKLPFEELRSADVTDAFEKAFNEEFEINVVATMSAGKSTLINALLANKLMPSKNGACTAKITRIKDDDDDTFKAVAYNSEDTELGKYSVLDYKTMQNLNNNPNVSQILVSGNIPFVSTNEASLVLIDTPGPDNAREEWHRLVTEKALEESSKMLVLFVMNGSKLHDEAQDAFLRKIAKSMAVGGKQSRERFLFVINKLDAYDEEDDDIAGETIPDTIKYLEEMGIESPNIFPAAAEPALLIRRYQKIYDEGERQKILAKLKPIAEKMVAQEQLHLEQYPTLVKNSQMLIESELNKAIEENDLLGQALIHTGIRGIEETIRMYVTKYCRPQKITNVVNTFKHRLDSAEAFEMTKREIVSREDEQEKFRKQIALLNEKLSSKSENEAFKKRISSLEISTDLDVKVEELIMNVQSELTLYLNKCSNEMEEDDAMAFVKNFAKLAGRKQDEFVVAVSRLLAKDVEEKSRKLLDEYIKKLVALNEEFSTDDLSIDLTSFVKGKFEQINADAVLDASLDSRVERHNETRSRTVTKRATGWKRILNPFRWFNPEYEDIESYVVEVKEEITFISGQKLIDQLLSPIMKQLYDERERIREYAKEQTTEIKKYFYEQFDEVDRILERKTQELVAATASKESSAAALADANKLLAELEKVKTELEKILEI